MLDVAPGSLGFNPLLGSQEIYQDKPKRAFEYNWVNELSSVASAQCMSKSRSVVAVCNTDLVVDSAASAAIDAGQESQAASAADRENVASGHKQEKRKVKQHSYVSSVSMQINAYDHGRALTRQHATLSRARTLNSLMSVAPFRRRPL